MVITGKSMLVQMWQNVKFIQGRGLRFYARPKVTWKYQVYQFFMSTKNLHIKSFTLIPSRLFFMSRWKFTHQVYYIVISCQFFKQILKYTFVDHVSCFDTKFLIFVWNTIFFPCLYNFFNESTYLLIKFLALNIKFLIFVWKAIFPLPL